jgi:hypothetical protein
MNEGLQIGHEMAEIAANNAGETWKRMAYEAFVKYAKSHEFFVTEDVRNNNLNMPPPPDKRAWGYIALIAKREDIVSSHSLVRSKSRICHGRILTMWKSNIFGEDVTNA